MNTEANKPRRARGEHGVRWSESRKRYIAEATVGYDGRGKRIVKSASGTSQSAALKALRERIKRHADGMSAGADRYTVRQAVEDWLKYGQGKADAETLAKHCSLCKNHILPELGARKLKDLTAKEIDEWLAGRAPHLSDASLQSVRSCLRRAIRRAVARNLAVRNVVEYCELPSGRPGRKSKSLTMEQARDVLTMTKGHPMYAYIVVSLVTGARTEEMRALTWNRVHLEATDGPAGELPPHVEVWRSVRAKGDTKTRKSRRTLALPQLAVEALRWQRRREVFGGLEPGLVFATATGARLDAANVRRDFRNALSRVPGIDPADWTPRELRHSFVSILSESGVAVEDIALLVGHSGTHVTELVYRHQLRPVIRKGAITMDTVFRTGDGQAVRQADREPA